MTEETVDQGTRTIARAIKDSKQAFDIYKNLVKQNEERNKKNARITRKLNGEQPFDQNKLQAAGQGWRKNYSTGFMMSHVKRILPHYISLIDSARVLTESRLSNVEGPGADEKKDTFAKIFTSTLRRWNGWKNFEYLLALEDLVYGYAAVALPDLYDWRPVFLRGDQALFPPNSSQNPEETEMWAMLDIKHIHDMAAKIANPEVAAQTGWNVQNIIKAINEAQPSNRDTVSDGKERENADEVYESNAGLSYTSDVKDIRLAHVFGKEPTGKVTHMILNERNGDELYVYYDKFESMDEFLRLMTIEVGNGKLHGSKGVGRQLYNLHVAVDQMRNLMADNLHLSGLVLLRGTQKANKKASVTVNHPLCILDENFEVVTTNFQANSESFMAYDKHVNLLAEILVGAYMPGQTLNDQGKQSAAATHYLASIEAVIRDGTLNRFWSQFMGVIHMIQKRMFLSEVIELAYKIYSAETATGARAIAQKIYAFIMKMKRAITGQYVPIKDLDYQGLDKVAVDTALDMMRAGLAPEEIYEMAQCPPQETTTDLANLVPGTWDGILSIYKGDPSVDQMKLKRRHMASRIGNNVATDLLIPEEDNTVTSEAARMQIMELNAMLDGEQMPVSPRDNDAVHMDVIRSKAEALMNSIQQANDPMSLPMLQNILSHYEIHLGNAKSKGAGGEQFMDYYNWFQSIKGMLERAAKQTQKNAPQPIPDGAQPLL